MRALGLNVIYKRRDLDASGISCAQYCRRNPCGSYSATLSCAAAAGVSNNCALLPATPLL